MKLQSLIPHKNKQLERQLREDTGALAMPKGRRVGQPGHDIAREHLLDRLDETGLVPFSGESFELPYTAKLYDTGKPHTFTNLVGVVPGTNRKLPPLLLGAHYDSVIDAPCADDNATSVAMNLAIAEMAMEWKLDRDLIIALYDAEEPPYFLSKSMGSTRFHDDHCRGMTFAGVIVTDLIGHDLCIPDLIEIPTMMKPLLPSTEKIVFMTGAESDGVFPEIVEEVSADHKGVRIFPTLNSYVGNLSDHHAFERNGHPFLFFSCAQGKYYHHKLDTIDWINFPKLAHITHFIADLLCKLDEFPAGEQADADDPVEFEIRMIRKALGPKLPLILKAVGVTMPETRDDLDELIGYLTGSVC
ncbi:MAG: M28 family peptidase [Akkermansiaceae bacterium]|nr:M28 family peptidase [Akkermansiaceae bacterium]